ncbi:glycosyltransferase family 39 protein [Geodermatophilus sp. DSM 44513]|uniref:ArnT family glycosyltransferase n=1 Tax=Geodermatophilus sp. DSM 44513 TaxID=1528104 RepID=UPI0012804C63|nr:glycosyltransferase family 39 protein [Geodermatophilus sp. DSM 44513]WNV75883.1 glycosyltransferase family 39 protein [Geodermatophilus sp. DSM 44513]
MAVARPIEGAGRSDTRTTAVTTPPSYGSRALPYLPLALLLLVQAVSAARLQNSPFQDEALYLSYGQWMIDSWVDGVPMDGDPEQWFTGAPQLYPVFAALLDGIGGLTLVRLFSALCMLSATAAVYWTATTLFRGPGHLGVGAFAALVFAASGPVLVLTRFATFDAPSIAAVAWALAVGCWAARRDDGRERWWAVLVGGLLALAVALKYASAIDAPFVLLAVAASTLHEPARRLRGLAVSVVAGLTALALLAVSAGTWARSLVSGVVASTIERQSLMPLPATELLARIAAEAGPMIAVGLVGGLVLLRRRPVLGAVLLVASVAAPLYQVHTGESVSLYKSTVLGLVFGAVLGGYLCSLLIRRWWGAPLAVVGLIWAVLYGQSVSASIFTSWPDTARLADAVGPLVVDSPGFRIAGENPEPLQYALGDRTEPWQWIGTYDGAFEYEGQADLPAFRAALSDGYFGVVVLDGETTIGRQLQQEIASFGYEQEAVVDTADGDHRWVVWQLTP